MVAVLRWIFFLALLAAAGAGLVALNNGMFTRHDPLWAGPVAMLCLFLNMTFLRWCERRGWIRGVFWNRPKELEDRKHALAVERERIIAEAVAKRG